MWIQLLCVCVFFIPWGHVSNHAQIWALWRHISHMGQMRDSDWSREILLRSDWLLPQCSHIDYSPPENFQVWRLRNAIFSTCHEICLRKIDLEPENGKQLQVTIIKITESKENNSIHRLDESGSTRPGGQLPPLAYPLATARVNLTHG